MVDKFEDTFQRHTGTFFFSIVLMAVVGFIDMRSAISDLGTKITSNTEKLNTVDKKVDTVTTISTMTRTEQLLRTDEIEYIQGIRDRYPDWSGKYLQEKKKDAGK